MRRPTCRSRGRAKSGAPLNSVVGPTKVTHFLISNYLSSGLIMCSAIGGILLGFLKWLRPHWVDGYRVRVGLGVCVAAFVLGIPAALIAGNLQLLEKRQGVSKNLRVFVKDIYERQKITEESWGPAWHNSFPSKVPWPLLVEINDFRKWLLESNQLQLDIKASFSPRVSRECLIAHGQIDRPHPATFEVDDKRGLVTSMSFSHDELNLLAVSLDRCSHNLDSEISAFAIPSP